MYKSLLLLTLLYGSEIWSPSYAELLKLESFQIKSIKCICSGSSYQDRLLKCKLLPTCCMLLFKDITMLNRILTGKYDLSAMQLIQIQYIQRLRSLFKPILLVNRTKKSIREKNFPFRAVRLGKLVQTCTSLNIFMDSCFFKSKLKTLLLVFVNEKFDNYLFR